MNNNRNENIMDVQTLEKLKRIYDQADSFGKGLMEKEFPELKESEDERIRKAIAEIVKNYGPQNANPKLYSDMLAWLEKQGKENTELQSDDGILEHKCAISAVEKLYTQTRWSEKDDAYSTLICSILNLEHPNGLYTTGGITFFQNAYIKNQQIKDWLNSIKQRLTIQTEEESK